jgi:2-oxoglutarate/2-oxoacid ferredoxin oxidoreductase subunit beta
MHDGSTIRLKKLAKDYDPTSKLAALMLLGEARATQQFVTGLIYIDQQRPNLVEREHLADTPLVQLPPEKLRPPRAALDEINASYM